MMNYWHTVATSTRTSPLALLVSPPITTAKGSDRCISLTSPYATETLRPFCRQGYGPFLALTLSAVGTPPTDQQSRRLLVIVSLLQRHCLAGHRLTACRSERWLTAVHSEHGLTTDHSEQWLAAVHSQHGLTSDHSEHWLTTVHREHGLTTMTMNTG